MTDRTTARSPGSTGAGRAFEPRGGVALQAPDVATQAAERIFVAGRYRALLFPQRPGFGC